MVYEEACVLIPSHSLEDLPTDLGEKDAASLLNAFAVAWHPLVLASTRSLPRWWRADEPPESFDNRLYVVPTPCESWLPHDWPDRARAAGAAVIAALHDRQDMLNAVLGPLQPEPPDVPVVSGHELAEPPLREGEAPAEPPSAQTGPTAPASLSALSPAEPVPPALAADFLALGTCWLQMELLTRQMHYFSNIDETNLQREALAAADAAVARDPEAARARLQTCFEMLTEARERFYPVDCYLIDLCLLIPRLADEHFERLVREHKPVNVLVAAEDLETIARERPQLLDELRESWHSGSLDMIGGEFREGPQPLLPMGSMLWNFEQGYRKLSELCGRTPVTWGRRRFGLSPVLPQILSRFGCHSALHVVLDDGLYPDVEQSKIRWEGCDGTTIDAITRIPLAADSATSFLRFPQRMAETMQSDQVAALLFARWPEVKSPWLDDFRRIAGYMPVLGKFVTFDEFFQRTDDPGRISTYKADEYLTPFLVQAVARQEPDPISRFARHAIRRHRFEAADWFHRARKCLTGEAIDPADDEPEAAVENAGPEAPPETAAEADAFIDDYLARSSARLAEIVLAGAAKQPGLLLLNSLSFPRTVCIDLPQIEAPPPIAGPVKAVQFDDVRRRALVELPESGFVWLPIQSEGVPPPPSEVPLAEELLLRNEFFEVHLNAETGGIATIKGHGRSPNRLSQQVACRFPRERTIPAQGDGEPARTWYSSMIRRSSKITCAGPALGEIVTEGDLVDHAERTHLATYRQTVRVWRGRRIVEIDLDLDIEQLPDGPPWTSYYAARFAWNDSSATLTRSVQQTAQIFDAERCETLHYFEIAAEDHRTTILPLGLPFHRKTGPRMLDTLLVASGETQRHFRFVVAVDADYPMQAALDAMTPVGVVPTTAGPPRPGTSGWFFHIAAKNVQIIRVMALKDDPAAPNDGAAVDQQSASPSASGFAVRLMETEGRGRHVRLRCFREPARARQRDLRGRTLGTLRVQGDEVLIDMTAYEIADIELSFD